MPNVVIIPCHSRPEFLGACLNRISLAEGWEKNHYLFCVDDHKFAGGAYNPQVIEVIKQFPGEKTVKIRPKDSIRSNTRNVLEGYKEAHRIATDTGGDLVYLIEEDILIARDFFTFHERVQAVTDEFFVSACRNQNYKAATKLPAEPESVYTYPRYQSLGNSFKLNQVAKFLPHCNGAYYGNMWDYLKNHFKGPKVTAFQGMWCEQDGMLNRFMAQNDLLGIFPYIPRAYHAGFYGYNRTGQPISPNLSLFERIIALLSMTEKEMNDRASNPQFKDITQCDPYGHDVKEFKVKQNVPL